MPDPAHHRSAGRPRWAPSETEGRRRAPLRTEVNPFRQPSFLAFIGLVLVLVVVFAVLLQGG